MDRDFLTISTRLICSCICTERGWCGRFGCQLFLLFVGKGSRPLGNGHFGSFCFHGFGNLGHARVCSRVALRADHPDVLRGQLSNRIGIGGISLAGNQKSAGKFFRVINEQLDRANGSGRLSDQLFSGCMQNTAQREKLCKIC